jgi:hypothetical protein
LPVWRISQSFALFWRRGLAGDGVIQHEEHVFVRELADGGAQFVSIDCLWLL